MKFSYFFMPYVYRSHMRKQYYMEVDSVNMKKSFPEEKGTKKGVKEFLEKKGFYVVLLLCIAVVAGTAIYVTMRNTALEDPNYEARDLSNEAEDDLAAEDVALNQSEKLNTQGSENDQATAEGQSDIGSPASVNTDGSSAAKPKEDKEKTTDPKETTTPEKTAAPKTKPTTPVKPQSFIMPVDGLVSLEYAMDKLVYSKTLEEWRAHSGVDIASDRGTPVKAVADGVVSDIRNDLYYGITVVIDHGNDLKSLYRNLAADDTVTVNQKVTQGEIIGSIGNTAMDESSEQPHLHFEVLEKDVCVDPTTYLPQIAEAAE